MINVIRKLNNGSMKTNKKRSDIKQMVEEIYEKKYLKDMVRERYKQMKNMREEAPLGENLE